MNRYLRERSDASIKSYDGLINKANFFRGVPDSRFPDKKPGLENANKPMTFDMPDRIQNQFAIQTMVIQCMDRSSAFERKPCARKPG